MALLLAPMQHLKVENFSGVIFRREHTQITSEGGLWDEAMKLYPMLGGFEVELGHSRFSSGTFRISLKGLGAEADLMKWQGTQIAYIGFDELTHFTQKQFFYMLSRNRSLCGIKPYVRATTNPDADSWVRRFIDWWIGKDGFPIEERSGVIRYFINDGGEIHWGDSEEELKKQFPALIPKSFTFIPAKLEDNKILTETDPSYLASLQALNRVDRERLLHGNWDAKYDGGSIFNRNWFEIVDELPKEYDRIGRAWDFAGTEPTPQSPDPDWTVGLKGYRVKDTLYITAMERFRRSPAIVEGTFVKVTKADGKSCTFRIPQDPGSAGKAVAHRFITLVKGYRGQIVKPTGSKESRAFPVASQAEVGNIKLLRGAWNEAFLSEVQGFPKSAPHDDIPDALSDLFDMLMVRKKRRGATINETGA